MTFLLYAVLVLTIYFLFGIGLALLMVPEREHRYVLLIAPWAGYCYITAAASILYDREIAVSDSYAFWLAAPAVLFGWVGARRFARNGWRPREFLRSTGSLALLPALLGFGLASLCLTLSPDQPTTMSAGNNDIANYASMARYIKEFFRSSAAGFVGQCGHTNDLDLRRLLDSFYFGPAAATAVCSSLLRCMPHHIQSLCVNLSFGMCVLAAFLLADGGLGFSRKLSLFGAFLLSLHPVIHYLVIQGFYAQVTGVGLMLLLLWMQLRGSADCRNTRQLIRAFPLFCLFFWGLLVSYVTMLLFTCGLLFAHAVVVMILTRKAKHVYYSVGLCLGSLLVCGLVSPGRVLGMLKTLLFLRDDAGGYSVRLLWPEALVGLVGRGVFLEGASLGTHIIPAIAISALGCICLRRAYLLKRYALCGLGVIVLLVYCGGLFLALSGSPGAEYKSFKLLSFYSPLFLLFALSIFSVLDPFAAAWQRIVAIAGCGVVVANMAYAQCRYFTRMRSGLTVTKSYGDLLHIDKDARYEAVNILGAYWWDVTWKSYFLMHKKQHFEVFTGAGRVAGPLLAEWDLKSVVGADVVEVRGDPTEEVEINADFRLTRAGGDRLGVVFGKGFYSSEGNHCWAGADGKVATLVVNSAAENALIDLRLEYSPFVGGNQLGVFMGGNPVGGALGPASYEAKNIELRKGANALEIVSEREAARIGPNDARLVTFLFKRVRVTRKAEHSRR